MVRYTVFVRRLLAILLLFVFGLPVAAPLLASAEPSSQLPVCCRRNGTHHCAKTAEEIEMLRHGAQFSARPMQCPVFPKALNAVYGHDVAVPVAALIYAGVMRHTAMVAQTEAWARVALECARHKRGPPVEEFA